MTDSVFEFWVYLVGQIATLFFVVWNKWEQRKLGKVIEQTHILSNSAYGASLAAWAKSARLVADRTNLASDRKIAEMAEQMSSDHAAKQAIADQAAQQ